MGIFDGFRKKKNEEIKGQSEETKNEGACGLKPSENQEGLEINSGLGESVSTA
jgi:hypothetical protein